MARGSHRDDQDPVSDRVTVKRKIPDAGAERSPGCTIYVNFGEVSDQGKRFVLTSGTAVLGRDDDCELCLADNNISRKHVELELVPEGILVRDLGSTNGVEHRGRRIDHAVLQPGARIVVGRSVIDLLPLTESGHLPLSERESYGELVGSSAPMRRVFSILESLESSDAPVLIQGETGTGKELTAQALQRHGRRAKMPFVIIDCSNIPRNLMEGELFGHTKGAFTGAVVNRRGAFEAADNGTVFLDEVDDLPLGLQPKLLRVLETGQVRRLGENTYRSVNTRVIATTKRDLVDAIRSNRFRSDLYYRLAVVKIRLPPLRERIEDIPLLAHHLMERIVGRPPAPLSTQAQAYLMRHRWPGNVRQLRNALERMMALRVESASDESELRRSVDITQETELPEARASADGDADVTGQVLRLEDPASAPRGEPPQSAADAPMTPFRTARQQALRRFEREYLEQLMERSAKNLSRASRIADIDRRYIRNLLKKHGLYQP